MHQADGEPHVSSIRLRLGDFFQANRVEITQFTTNSFGLFALRKSDAVLVVLALHAPVFIFPADSKGKSKAAGIARALAGVGAVVTNLITIAKQSVICTITCVAALDAGQILTIRFSF